MAVPGQMEISRDMVPTNYTPQSGLGGFSLHELQHADSIISGRASFWGDAYTVSKLVDEKFAYKNSKMHIDEKI